MRKRCIDMVYELAKKDPRVVFIGSDLSPGLLSDMQREFPDRYFMEGISEANVIGMAAGLALGGGCLHAQTAHSPHFQRRRFGLCAAWAHPLGH
jgi:transketolase